MYHQRKSTTIFDLPPTGHAAKGYILRAFYATHIQIKCLNNVSLDTLQHSFRMEEGNLGVDSFHCPLPEHMATNYNCMKCATSRCPCREENLPCCVFCMPVKRTPNGVIYEKQII